MQKVTPFMWFNDNAEEAAHFYCSVFRNSKILEVRRYGEGAPAANGSVMSVTFSLDGQVVHAFNGGPAFTFTPAISFFVECATQEEVDVFWEKLSEGGEKQQCGWLKDKYGVSWQIVPSVLSPMLQDKDGGKSKRVMMAMLHMGKLEIAALQQAYEGA